eukprot:96162-Chlamydomonas_euryale.AAC.5
MFPCITSAWPDGLASFVALSPGLRSVAVAVVASWAASAVASASALPAEGADVDADAYSCALAYLRSHTRVGRKSVDQGGSTQTPHPGDPCATQRTTC